jgi:hypothetical protein
VHGSVWGSACERGAAPSPAAQCHRRQAGCASNSLWCTAATRTVRWARGWRAATLLAAKAWLCATAAATMMLQPNLVA